MTTYATLSDLLEVDPTITDYGVLDYEAELAKSQADVIRLLRVRWWPTFRKNAGLGDTAQMDDANLDSTQWTSATVYHCLAHHIGPKLSKFEEVPDRFRNQMDYYSQRFEGEFDLCTREGVRYQLDDNAAWSDAERASDTSLRLRR